MGEGEAGVAFRSSSVSSSASKSCSERFDEWGSPPMEVVTASGRRSSDFERSRSVGLRVDKRNLRAKKMYTIRKAIRQTVSKSRCDSLWSRGVTVDSSDESISSSSVIKADSSPLLDNKEDMVKQRSGGRVLISESIYFLF